MTDESIATIWTELNGTLVEFDCLRYDYFTDGVLLMGEIQTHITNANDVYSTKAKSVTDWMDLVQPLLSIHSLAQKGSAHRKIMDKALNDGTTKLSSVQQDLEKISMSLNPLASNLLTLNAQFNDEFETKRKCFQSKLNILRAASAKGSIDRIEKELIPKIMEKIESYQAFRSNLKQKVQQEFQNIDGMKAKLRTEIQRISDLKVKIEPVITFMNVDLANRDDLNNAVKELIADCNKYRETHKN